MEELTLNEQLDPLIGATGIEKEEKLDPSDSEKIAEPFDPDNIDVVTRQMTVDLLLSRTESGMINLQPDFQRRWGVWDQRRQSRLIESLLLRIPLPVLYAAEDEDERWEIVDGIQRLSTIARFIKPGIIGERPLVLSGLEYLHDYVGKTFAELSPRLKMRLREAELIIHLIRKGTPPEVKFNIFARINTGGLALSPQELRHAITPGKARVILENWANLPSFIEATDGSVQPTRMDDRELVLRFLAFYLLGLERYKQPDMDGFLISAMRTINDTNDTEIENIKSRFESALKTAYVIFGKDAFRKRYAKDAGRLPINKAIFEALAVNLAKLPTDDLERLQYSTGAARTEFIQLCNDRDFDNAVSQGTGDVRRVNQRFSAIKNMIDRVLWNA